MASILTLQSPAGQSDERFMYEGRRLQRMSWRFIPQVTCRKAPQFPIDQWDQHIKSGFRPVCPFL
jgi:hypothetical protein